MFYNLLCTNLQLIATLLVDNFARAKLFQLHYRYSCTTELNVLVVEVLHEG